MLGTVQKDPAYTISHKFHHCTPRTTSNTGNAPNLIMLSGLISITYLKAVVLARISRKLIIFALKANKILYSIVYPDPQRILTIPIVIGLSNFPCSLMLIRTLANEEMLLGRGLLFRMVCFEFEVLTKDC